MSVNFSDFVCLVDSDSEVEFVCQSLPNGMYRAIGDGCVVLYCSKRKLWGYLEFNCFGRPVLGWSLSLGMAVTQWDKLCLESEIDRLNDLLA
jgi:hypothetical protein